jgi:hypothetical protein
MPMFVFARILGANVQQFEVPLYHPPDVSFIRAHL